MQTLEFSEGMDLSDAWTVVASPSGPTVSAHDGYLSFSTTAQSADDQVVTVTTKATFPSAKGCFLAFRARVRVDTAASDHQPVLLDLAE